MAHRDPDGVANAGVPDVARAAGGWSWQPPPTTPSEPCGGGAKKGGGGRVARHATDQKPPRGTQPGVLLDPDPLEQLVATARAPPSDTSWRRGCDWRGRQCKHSPCSPGKPWRREPGRWERAAASDGQTGAEWESPLDPLAPTGSLLRWEEKKRRGKRGGRDIRRARTAAVDVLETQVLEQAVPMMIIVPLWSKSSPSSSRISSTLCCGSPILSRLPPFLLYFWMHGYNSLQRERICNARWSCLSRSGHTISSTSTRPFSLLVVLVTICRSPTACPDGTLFSWTRRFSTLRKVC